MLVTWNIFCRTLRLTNKKIKIELVVDIEMACLSLRECFHSVYVSLYTKASWYIYMYVYLSCTSDLVMHIFHVLGLSGIF